MEKTLRVKRPTTPPIDEDILRAAEILERDAYASWCLWTVPTKGGGKAWPSGCKNIRVEFKELRRIARRLRRYVGTL